MNGLLKDELAVTFSPEPVVGALSIFRLLLMRRQGFVPVIRGQMTKNKIMQFNHYSHNTVSGKGRSQRRTLVYQATCVQLPTTRSGSV